MPYKGPHADENDACCSVGWRLKKVARKMRVNCCSSGGGSFRFAPALRPTRFCCKCYLGLGSSCCKDNTLGVSGVSSESAAVKNSLQYIQTCWVWIDKYGANGDLLLSMILALVISPRFHDVSKFRKRTPCTDMSATPIHSEVAVDIACYRLSWRGVSVTWLMSLAHCQGPSNFLLCRVRATAV